jgi:hypothetical protein
MLATTDTQTLTPAFVNDRVQALRKMHTETFADRFRIRTIMNGGAEGIAAIMAWDQGKGASGRLADVQELGTDLPTVNLMWSGNERLAQQVGRAPTLKMPVGHRDKEGDRRKAEKRERIVEGWDHMARRRMHYPQIGRWLPGYGFYVQTISERKDPVTGAVYPIAKLRDPYDAYPGWFGPDQEPHELAIVRKVPFGNVVKEYPWAAEYESKYSDYFKSNAGRAANGGRMVTWEGKATGVEVAEYHCEFGTVLLLPEIETILDFMPNPIESGSAFVVPKRFSFDRPQSQWHHVIGLSAMMAKLNILALIAGEDNVFAPLVMDGELVGNTWETGRGSVNEVERGTQVKKIQGDSTQELFMQIDRLERQLRVGGQYDVGQDAEVRRSGFITGAGQRELQGASNANVAEYHTVIADGEERVDSKRLEWDYRMHLRQKKQVYVLSGNKEYTETYTPYKDIAGNFRSRRIYGMMASWDDNSKIVAGLQLLQGDIIDPLTFQENLDGLDDVAQVNERIARYKAINDMYLALSQLAGQNDPRALAALVEIADDPANRQDTLKKFFTPQEPQMSPEEEAMMAAQSMGGGGAPAGPPPDVATVLSQIEASGQTQGGVQTVGRL